MATPAELKREHLERMLATNRTQKDFYEYEPAPEQTFEYRGNIIGRTWARLRAGYGTIVNSLGEFEM